MFSLNASPNAVLLCVLCFYLFIIFLVLFGFSRVVHALNLCVIFFYFSASLCSKLSASCIFYLVRAFLSLLQNKTKQTLFLFLLCYWSYHVLLHETFGGDVSYVRD